MPTERVSGRANKPYFTILHMDIGVKLYTYSETTVLEFIQLGSI